jgi:hypothetical protein
LVETLVPIIAAAPVTAATRQNWLERLFNACQEDDPPTIESLGHHWGTLCASPMIASRRADDLLPSVRGAMADRRRGVHAFTKSGTPCLSALFTAGRFDELTQVLALDPKPFWHEQQWAAKVLAARGDVDGAIRAIAKRYPMIAPERILGDLIASTPGQEGKWFAAAKTLKQYDLALALAQRSAVDPKTLVRAARDHALAAGQNMGQGEQWLGVSVAQRIAQCVAGPAPAARWVRQCLGQAALPARVVAASSVKPRRVCLPFSSSAMSA